MYVRSAKMYFIAVEIMHNDLLTSRLNMFKKLRIPQQITRVVKYVQKFNFDIFNNA